MSIKPAKHGVIISEVRDWPEPETFRDEALDCLWQTIIGLFMLWLLLSGIEYIVDLI